MDRGTPTERIAAKDLREVQRRKLGVENGPNAEFEVTLRRVVRKTADRVGFLTKRSAGTSPAEVRLGSRLRARLSGEDSI